MAGTTTYSGKDRSLLFRWGGIAALGMVGIIVAQTVLFTAYPPPENIHAWFTLFQRNALLGLLSFELLMVVYVLLSVPLSLAICAALGPAQRSLSALYLVFTVVGVVLFIVARPAFELMRISDLYAATTDGTRRAALLLSGEAVLATFEGMAFHVSYVLGAFGGVIISIAMFRSTVFSKSTAVLRLASSVLDFGLFIPQVGLYISLVSVLVLLVWDLLVARRLLRLATGNSG